MRRVQWMRVVLVAIAMCAAPSAEAQRRRSPPTTTVREGQTIQRRLQRAETALNNGEFRKCYDRYRTLIEIYRIPDRVRTATAEGDVPVFTADEHDLLLDYGRCADGIAQAAEDPVEEFRTLEEAIWAFDLYTNHERRMDHARHVSAATLRSSEITLRYLELRDLLGVEPPKEAPPPRVAIRLPLNLIPPPSDEDRFGERLASAHHLLAEGWTALSYEIFLALTRDPLGGEHPDVAWGMARSSDLSCADADEAARRLEWILIALEWYQRYLTLETRPEHTEGATCRATRARTALATLGNRASRIETQLATMTTPVPAASAESFAIPSDNRLHDPAERAARAKISALAPDIVRTVDEHPEYSYAEILEKLRCFARHHMARVRFMEWEGKVSFVFDQFPSLATQCPP